MPSTHHNLVHKCDLCNSSFRSYAGAVKCEAKGKPEIRFKNNRKVLIRGFYKTQVRGKVTDSRIVKGTSDRHFRQYKVAFIDFSGCNWIDEFNLDFG